MKFIWDKISRLLNKHNDDPYYNSSDFNYEPPPLSQNQPKVEYIPPHQNYGYQNNTSQPYQPYQTYQPYQSNQNTPGY